jgi:proline iminopeptidase
MASLGFYPKRKPYKTGYLPVSDGHKLYYALYGNPNGVPILIIHGGPGAGCSDTAYRYYDPRTCNILALDQRGAGRSKPFASLRGNTTDKLVKDFRTFLKFLKIKKVFIAGGSWGSCLGLCYAIKYPQTVLGMSFRGIYLGSNFVDDFMLSGRARTHFPEPWIRFVSHVPQRYRSRPCTYYWKMMRSKNPKTTRKYCQEWALYETSLLSLEYNLSKALKKIKSKFVIPLSLLEAHYIGKNCFLPKNYIIRNVHKLAHIPCSIVHGRYDCVCPPENAYVLHKALPKSRLHFVTAGHSAKDPEIVKLLMREMKYLIKNYA